MIKLIDGYHITTTEKKHITELLKNKIAQGGNKTKQYKLESLGNDTYRVQIASKYKTTIGADTAWHKDTITIKVKE